MTTKITPGDVVCLEGVDVPSGVRFHYVQNGKTRLRVMIAPAQLSSKQLSPNQASEARGSILFQPGRTEFIEKFFETAIDLTSRGFAVLIYDPRGQGFSSRPLPDPMKCFVRDYEEYCDDLAFVTESFIDDLPKPHIVMGHSMGGVIGLQTILSGRLNPAACAFTAPMLQLQDIDMLGMRTFIKLISLTALKYKTLPFQVPKSGHLVPFRSNKLTTDPERYKIWATYFENYPKLWLGAPTFGWISASLKAMKFVNANAEHLNIPSMITACGADPIVTPASNEEFARKAGSDFLNVPGALHEILLEKDEFRDQFWNAFDTFLDKNGL
ncbi:MAG: alpha/beta fold hydrolase [Robiginitomaculum sp.]